MVLPRVPLSLADLIANHARTIPQRSAIVTERGTLTWLQFSDLVERVATLLAQAEVQVGDRVAVASDDPVAFLSIVGAAARCRAVFVPVPTALRPNAAQRMIEHCAPTIVVHDSRLQEYVSAAPPSRLGMSTDSVLSLAASVEPRVGVRNECRAEDSFLILYTSGTTGRPRGVERTTGTAVAWRCVLAEHAQLDANTVTVLATPLYGGMTLGCVFPTLAVGGTCVFAGEFSPSRFLDLSREIRATFCQLVPTQWKWLLESPSFCATAMGSFRRVVSGGSPLDPRTKAELFAMFPRSFSEMYGTSESGAITNLSGEAPPGKRDSVGLPLRDARINIITTEGRRASPDTDGEIVAHTTRLMKGYYDERPEGDSWWLDPVSGNRFYRTGDIGRIDANGYLWIHGRQKEIIITAGLNIHPSDIEAVLLTHDAVSEASVVGRPDRILGETPVAFVVTKPGIAVTAGDLCRWTNRHVSPSQRLHSVRIVTALPRNAAGKVLKNVLIESDLRGRSGHP